MSCLVFVFVVYSQPKSHPGTPRRGVSRMANNPDRMNVLLLKQEVASGRVEQGCW